jgi:hypothetical protein
VALDVVPPFHVALRVRHDKALALEAMWYSGPSTPAEWIASSNAGRRASGTWLRVAQWDTTRGWPFGTLAAQCGHSSMASPTSALTGICAATLQRQTADALADAEMTPK